MINQVHKAIAMIKYKWMHKNQFKGKSATLSNNYKWFTRKPWLYIISSLQAHSNLTPFFTATLMAYLSEWNSDFILE